MDRNAEVIFTQPPGYWDSLEALGAALKQSEWLVWIDFDLTLPGAGAWPTLFLFLFALWWLRGFSFQKENTPEFPFPKSTYQSSWESLTLRISPCCYDSFSMTELIQGSPHIVVRDSPHEDYHHHCANAGFLVVRNTAIGRLFIDLARETLDFGMSCFFCALRCAKDGPVSNT